MMSSAPPQILDITVKEGGARVYHRLLPEQVADIARSLQDAGVSHAELSHGCGIGSFHKGYPGLASDGEILAAAREAAPDLKIAVFVYPSLHSVPEIRPLGRYFDIARIGLNPNELEMADPHFEELKSLGKRIFAQLQRVHLFSPDVVAEAGRKLAERGAEVVYISDSFGSLEESDVMAYLSALKQRVSVPLGFQGRNTRGLGITNSLAAYRSGATWLDAAIAGMGPGAGMTQLEVLVSLFQRERQLEEINLAAISNTLRHYVMPLLHTYPHVTYPELIMAKHRVDYYPALLLERIADILDMPFEAFIADLKSKENFTQLRERELRAYLARENLDLDVVMDFIRTGKVPGEIGSEA